MVEKEKLDIFKLLRACDKRDMKFYDTLTENEKKTFADRVAMRWLSDVNGQSFNLTAWYLMQTNNNVNKHLWNPSLKDHPKLKYLTMASSGVGFEPMSKNQWGKVQNSHQWIPQPKRKHSGKIYEFVELIYPMANHDEIQLFIDMNDIDDFVNLAMEMGWQKDEIAKLKKEFKKIK